VDVDLFIKKMPYVIKKLISREAFDNRRSLNQEAIALLEEALVQRVESTGKKRMQVEAMLERYAEPLRTAPAVAGALAMPAGRPASASYPEPGLPSAQVPAN